ncbi:hypothetical protein HMPREF0004_3934 [Achromobacter piechaudii ATCC 43553]|uniref:Zinc ribbon domain-containing protein n=1 Tax=Achromobacter piechaudii ATCC 43553 TaxID=742159 RepID=D4XEN7_9BURK|nr:hypothetical protein HMPREF0004_3934 [Achromobacter piechaudii ATCC 43553]
MFLLIFLWIVLAIVVGVMAAGRGRRGIGWTILACLISPPLAGAFLLALPDHSPRTQENVAPAYRECPECEGRILSEARVCRHCGVEVEDSRPAA